MENETEKQADKPTLESLFRERLADPRAMVGALSIHANRILLTFGDVGPFPRVVLHFAEDGMTILQPAAEAEEERTGQEPGQGDGAPKTEETPDLTKLSKADLLAKAEAAGVTVAPNATKAQIIAALTASK